MITWEVFTSLVSRILLQKGEDFRWLISVHHLGAYYMGLRMAVQQA